MSSVNVPPFETILKLCVQSRPDPWYPAEFAASMGAPAARLAGPCEELRKAGLIESTPYREGRGPGYRLTDDGIEVLRSPRLMDKVRAGELPEVEREPEEVEVAGARSPRSIVLGGLLGETRPYVAYTLLAINVLLFFVAMNIALKGNGGQGNVKLFLMVGDVAARHRTGAVTSGDIMNGKWWRLGTSFFVHKDFFHLLIVMGAFMGFARRSEQFWGPVRFALIYLISGFAGTCLTLWRNPAESPVGAEGAVCGSLAATAVWFLLNRRFMPDEIYRTGLRQTLFGFAWFIAWAAFLAFLGAPRLSWSGYVAGTVAGGIVAICLNSHRLVDSPVRWMFAVPVLLVPIACVGVLVRAKGDPAWKNKAAEIGKKQKRGDEFEIFNKQLSPVIDQARAFFGKRWSAVSDLCEEPAVKRRKLEVDRVKETLAEGRAATDQALAQIQAAGEFESDRVSDVLRAAKTYLNEQKKLIDLAERCLDEREDFPPADLKELRRQAEQTERSLDIYDKK